MGRRSSTSAGYDEFRALLLKKHPDLLKRKDWSAIEVLAKPFVTKKYEKEWKGSKSRKNYWEKYRAAWDAAHAGGK